MENKGTVVNRAKLIPKLFPRFRNNGTTYYAWGRDWQTLTLELTLFKDLIKTLFLEGLLYFGGLAVKPFLGVGLRV